MTHHSHSEPGGKAHNEDFVIVRRHPKSGSAYICLLADGQGGQSNGALAARTACEAAWKLASEQPIHRLMEKDEWTCILEETDSLVAATGGYTTLIALALDFDTASGASSGDSKVYFKSASSQEITEWTSKQSKNPPVGTGSAEFRTFTYDDIEGGRVLMLSDGVWKYCGYEAIQASFNHPVDFLPEYFRSAIFQRAGATLPDDLSIIAVDLD